MDRLLTTTRCLLCLLGRFLSTVSSAIFTTSNFVSSFAITIVSSLRSNFLGQ